MSALKNRRFVQRIARWALFGVIVGLLALTTDVMPQSPKVPSSWTFTLPRGNVFDGEKAFAKMQCYSCHNVAGRYYVDPAERPGGLGPDLTAAHARLPREYLAESIVNFERFLAHGNFAVTYKTPDGSSRMGDYSHIMTVRELIDIVEFLKAIQ